MSTRDMNKEAIDKVLSRKVLFVSENAQTYLGTPTELIEEIADALPNYPDLIASAMKKILPEELLDVVLIYCIAAMKEHGIS